MRLNIFKKPPTTAQVAQEQNKLEQRRETIRQRMTELDELLVQLYGADDPDKVAASHAEYDQLQRELATLGTVSQRLELERTDAVQRELLAATKARYETMREKLVLIRELNPQIVELTRSLAELKAESNQVRYELSNMRGNDAYDMKEFCKQHGLDAGDVLPAIHDQITALRSEYRDALGGSVAVTADAALNITASFPSMADPQSGLKREAD